MTRQVFYHYRLLEEHAAGLWRRVPADEAESFVQASAALMRAPQSFLEAMRRAAGEWTRSMEAAVTTPSINLRAYFGHAGCCIAHGSPEHLTRLGWHLLTQEEQDEANRMADIAIAEYEVARSIEKGWLW